MKIREFAHKMNIICFIVKEAARNTIVYSVKIENCKAQAVYTQNKKKTITHTHRCNKPNDTKGFNISDGTQNLLKIPTKKIRRIICMQINK